MNSFGRLFRVHIFGESHGPVVGCIIDGCLPGLQIIPDDFTTDLNRRKGGQMPGTTPRSEEDIPNFKSGVFNERSTGAPVMIEFKNKEQRSKDYESLKATPRPGHADFVAHTRFKGFEDYRGGGHFSGRLTAPLVAAGVIAKKILLQLQPNVQIQAKVIEVGGNSNIDAGIAKAVEENDTAGSIIECRVSGLPVGLGEPFFDSVESLISHAAFSIPAVKGIEFGSGFKSASMKGIEHNDPIINQEGETSTNHAGGVSGGLTNGNELVFRIVVKPASSTPQIQYTFNTHKNAVEPLQVLGRHDLVIGLRVPPVLEAITACVLADLTLIHK